jgi:spectinomycin phosphotransferase
VIVEHPDIPAARVGSVVRREWVVDINTVDHVEVGSTGWHWVLGDDDGPRWFATVVAARTYAERRSLVEAFEAASSIARELPFTVAPVHTRGARVALDIAPGCLLTVAPYVEGDAFGSGSLTGDLERGVVASMMGELHRQPSPRTMPVWRPQLGRHDNTRRADLERRLAQEVWSGGPWSVPASRMVLESRPAIRAALRRYSLLAAAVTGSMERWVVTHGEPHARNLMRTPDGPRLVDWSTVALAPRERDLGDALGAADGEDPWYSYLEAGGRPVPLSADTMELFALQSHLSGLCEHAVRFSRAHDDTPDERRCFGDLERELGSLVSRWA